MFRFEELLLFRYHPLHAIADIELFSQTKVNHIECFVFCPNKIPGAQRIYPKSVIEN